MRDTSKQATVSTNPSSDFNGVKVFSATMFANRDQLGEQVSDWIAAHPKCAVRDMIVTQSSDAAFHCIAISLFYREELAVRE